MIPELVQARVLLTNVENAFEQTIKEVKLQIDAVNYENGKLKQENERLNKANLQLQQQLDAERTRNSKELSSSESESKS